VQARQKATNLAAVALQPALRELAANPMLLTTMALIHQQDTRLPDERVCLYDRAVTLLLHRWERQRVSNDMLLELLGDARRLRQIMERLAYEAHQSGASPYGVEDLSGNVWEWTRSLEDTIPTRRTRKSGRGENIFGRVATEPVCCGAARSATATGSCGVPIATGSARMVRAGASDFGWWCAHAADPLGSVPLASGGDQRGSPLWSFSRH
jgi:hypothetical protein